MLYENEIALPDDHQMKPATDSEEAHYEWENLKFGLNLINGKLTLLILYLYFSLKVTCLYDINTSHAVAFHTRPRRSEPYAENSEGQLHVVMRLSLGNQINGKAELGWSWKAKSLNPIV